MSATATPADIEARVIEAIESFGPAGAVTRDATFEDLDIDSLDLVELAQVAEEDYGVELKSEDLKDLKSVGAAVDLIVARASA